MCDMALEFIWVNTEQITVFRVKKDSMSVVSIDTETVELHIRKDTSTLYAKFQEKYYFVTVSDDDKFYITMEA